MERRVYGDDVADVRKATSNLLDGVDHRRQVDRRHRDRSSQLGDDCIVDERRIQNTATTVDDPVTNSLHCADIVNEPLVQLVGLLRVRR